jgi:Zn-dependent protease
MFPDFSNPDVLRQSLTRMVALVLAIAVHEYAHALAAYRLGDDTAARQGRLTLNPAAHADVLGTLILPLFIGFGWGKPVPYMPTRLSRRFSMRAGEAIIAFAGPLANLLMAIVAGGLWVGLLATGVIGSGSPFHRLLPTMLGLNLSLFFFNLLPVPPLDGSKVLAWMLGRRADGVLDRIQGMGMIGLMVAMLIGGRVIGPAVHYSMTMVLRAFGAIFG